MLWRSRKAVDLLRDPRLTVHSAVADRYGDQFVLSGRAKDIRDSALRESYRRAVLAKVGWQPEEPRFHLFGVEIGHAAYITYVGDTQRIDRWP